MNCPIAPVPARSPYLHPVGAVRWFTPFWLLGVGWATWNLGWHVDGLRWFVLLCALVGIAALVTGVTAVGAMLDRRVPVAFGVVVLVSVTAFAIGLSDWIFQRRFSHDRAAFEAALAQTERSENPDTAIGSFRVDATTRSTDGDTTSFHVGTIGLLAPGANECYVEHRAGTLAPESPTGTEAADQMSFGDGWWYSCYR